MVCLPVVDVFDIRANRMKKIILISLLICGLIFLGYFTAEKFGFFPLIPYIQNYEEDEFAGESEFIRPTIVVDGLAIYSVGAGEPVLLLPYPHAHTKEPMAQGPIANALVGMGKTVITFDVPGAYQSTQTPVGDIAEMLSSADKALEVMDTPIDVVGHSMSGLSALAFAIEHPEHTNRLVLIGAMSGFPAAIEYGMPKSVWKVNQPEYWKFILLGLKDKLGFGSLADHKALYNIMSEASFHDRSLFIPLEIEEDDSTQGVPVREIAWGKNMFRQLDYSDRLNAVGVETLIIAGRYDPEAPIPCSEELHQGIPNSKLIIFENSGHYPFLEESELFAAEISAFLNSGSDN